MADITTNQASNPLRRATSFYDFSSLESNNGGATAPNVPLATGGKPNDNEAGGEGNGTPANGGTPATSEAGGTPAGGTTPVTSETGSGAAGGTGTTPTPEQDNPYAKLAAKSYEDMERIIRSRMNELPPDETKEERVKRERREKQQGFLARLADGLGSFHTTFAYARGEKPMDMPQMSKRATELYEKAKAAREKNRDLRMNYALRLGDLGNEKAKTLREIDAQQEAQRLAREKGLREAEAHDWERNLQPDKLREQAGKATTAEQKAITAGEEAKNAPELYKARVDTEKARGRAQNASATNSYASANEHNTNAGQGFPWWDEHGGMHLAKTKDEAIYRQTQAGNPIMETNTGGETHTTTETPETRFGRPVRDANGKPVTKKTTRTQRRAGYVPMRPAKPAKAKPAGNGRKSTGVKWK